MTEGKLAKIDALAAEYEAALAAFRGIKNRRRWMSKLRRQGDPQAKVEYPGVTREADKAARSVLAAYQRLQRGFGDCFPTTVWARVRFLPSEVRRMMAVKPIASERRASSPCGKNRTGGGRR
jgi:hypothetical protein